MGQFWPYETLIYLSSFLFSLSLSLSLSRLSSFTYSSQSPGHGSNLVIVGHDPWSKISMAYTTDNTAEIYSSPALTMYHVIQCFIVYELGPIKNLIHWLQNFLTGLMKLENCLSEQARELCHVRSNLRKISRTFQLVRLGHCCSECYRLFYLGYLFKSVCFWFGYLKTNHFEPNH